MDRGAALSGLRSVWVTADGMDHAVADEEIAAGRSAGRFMALCGLPVAPAALSTPPGPRCDRCLVFLRARATLRELASPVRQRRLGFCGRWWRRG